MFSFSFDSQAGILMVRPVGAWTLDEIGRYSDELAIHVPKARRAAGELRLLIDNRACQLATRELAEPLGRAGAQVAAVDDRIAIIVSTTLMKMQTKRLLGAAPHGVFLTEEEGRAWLTSPAKAA